MAGVALRLLPREDASAPPPPGATDADGLRPGTYGVTALDTRTQARLDLRIEIDGDQQILLQLPEPPQESGRP